MSYADGIISITTSGGVTYGVSIYDIQQALNISNYDDIGGLITQGAQQEKINMWTKYKPFAYTAWGFANATALQNALASRNCGLVMRKYASTSAAWTAGVALAEGETDWVYMPPTGGSVAPYRFLDFDGYDSNMGAPFRYGPTPNPAYKTSTVVIGDTGAGANASNILQSDLAGNGDQTLIDNVTYAYYDVSEYHIYCMLTKRPNPGPAYLYAPSNNSINSILEDGTWDCVTILSSVTITEGRHSSVNGDIILAPNCHSTFVYHNTLGINYNNTRVESLSIKFELSSYPSSISYTKFMLITKYRSNNQTIEEKEFGTSGGTLHPTPDISTFTVVPDYPASTDPNTTKYFLRIYVGASQYEEEFTPAYNPTE